MNRRSFIQAGSIGGLTLPQLLQGEPTGGIAPPAKSLIHIYLPGGMAHQESWDPKPFSPLEYRGPFSAINTAVDGLQFGEVMKDMAKVADKITVIHSMTHGEAAHDRGTQNMFTGFKPSPAINYPSFGTIVTHELGTREALPPYICIPTQPNPHAGTGYLSPAYGPFGLGSDPASVNFKVRDIALPEGISEDRFLKRRSLLAMVDDSFNATESSKQLDAMNSFYQDAYSMIASRHARDAFDISKEKDKTRRQYGENTAGMRMIMARRLVEAGVRLVTLTYGGWDHHNNIHKSFGDKNGPELDRALAALINDLDERGLLDETIVMVTSEFGRTPKINTNAGRDHWPKVFSAVLAGGGIKRGYVHGASDSTATQPEESPTSPADIAATIYNQLGIDIHKKLMATGGRPIDIVYNGNIIREIL
tara:strand:- start:1548 stop:2807 length:1260 start_codon:yes stop_codon:yes gene_type:complete